MALSDTLVPINVVLEIFHGLFAKRKVVLRVGSQSPRRWHETKGRDAFDVMLALEGSKRYDYVYNHWRKAGLRWFVFNFIQ